MTVDEEVARLLHDLGQGVYAPTTVGGDIFLGALPEAPDVATAVGLYGSGAEGDARLGYDQVRVQLLVRGDQDARTASARAQRHYDALIGLRSKPLPGGTWLCLCTAVQAGPFWLGIDELRRHEYAVNMAFMLRRKTAERE